MSRKIVALHTGRAARADNSLYTLALCSDGSLWRYVADGAGNPWREVPLPPGCGSLPAAIAPRRSIDNVATLRAASDPHSGRKPSI